ncbi:MAG TPA: tripartite tricarboxylate transporter substrate-binding protein [Alphaproteobacteria bacterium]|nr:tripartite tricarboxylate transporter substrate-binding protein [Alphaproteobacteria bacterium]
MIRKSSGKAFALGLGTAAFVAAGVLTTAPAKADMVADFYKGRDITFIVGFSVGGSYGAYSRLLARHMSQYIPGKPNIVVKHRRGGGGLRAANYLYNVAPKDGTMLGFLADSLAVAQLMFPKKAKYDAAKMTYIGRLTPVNPVVMIRNDHKVKNIKDVLNNEVIISCSGKGSQSFIMPKAMKEILGMKFRLICGYKGSAPQSLALERGDVHAQSSAWASWRIRRWDDVQSGKLIPLVQIGLKREKDLPNIPLMQDLTNDQDEKTILEFLSVGGAVGRTLIAPPGVPGDRIAALRAAFQKTVKDDKFLADAKKRKANIDPLTGEELDAITKKALATPKPLVERTRAALQGYTKNCTKDCVKKKKKKAKDGSS